LYIYTVIFTIPIDSTILIQTHKFQVLL